MDIFEFCEQFPTKEHAIAYMRNRGLLKQIAPVCGRNGCVRHMTHVKNPSFQLMGISGAVRHTKDVKYQFERDRFLNTHTFHYEKDLCWLTVGLLVYYS